MSPIQRNPRRTVIPGAPALTLALVFGTQSAQALEPLKLYDNFNAPVISPTLWPDDGEITREISGKQLHLRFRSYGNTTSNTDYTIEGVAVAAADPQLVTEMKATIDVTAVQTTACATNATEGAARARIFGDLFNSGSTTQGDATGDVTVQARIVRVSDSTDPPDEMHVLGDVFLCHDATCAHTQTISEVDLGTVILGTSVTLEWQWDRAHKRFLFTRDNGTPMAAPYSVSDTGAAGLPSASVGLKNNVPNCTDPNRPSTFIDALFDNVEVNKSAAP